MHVNPPVQHTSASKAIHGQYIDTHDQDIATHGQQHTGTNDQYDRLIEAEFTLCLATEAIVTGDQYDTSTL